MPSRHGRMFWGAFAWGIQTQLFELVGDPHSDRKGVTGAIIRDTLISALPTIAEPGMAFIQDNAPVHMSHVVQDWLKDFSDTHEVRLVDWPPYSPDLNPIENIWKLLKDAINVKYPDLKRLSKNAESLQALIRAATVCWEELDERVFESVIKSMPKRMDGVINAKGWYTGY